MNPLFVIGWLLLGVLGTRTLIAHMQRKFPGLSYESRGSDLAFGMVLMLTGPIGFLFGIVLSGFVWHRTMFLTYEEYAAVHKARWPSLSPMPKKEGWFWS